MPEQHKAPTVPAGWTEAPLGQVADVVFSNVDKKSWRSELPVRLCNYLDVYQNDYLGDDHDYMVATASHAEVRKFGLCPGDVLITKDSETPDDIGIPAVIDSVTGTLVCGYHLALIRPGICVGPVFIAKQIQHERIQRYFGKEANGITRYGLSTASVTGLPLWFPPIREQHRIAAVFRTIDEAIRRTEQVIRKLQQMKQGLLHDLLTRGVDDNGDPRDPARTPEAFADTELGVVPRHWEVGGFSMFRCPDRQLIKTGPFGTAMTGRRWADTGVPVITIGSLGERELIRENLLFLAANDAKAFSSYELREGDVVFSRVADVGRSLVIRAAQAGWIMSSNLMRISLDNARVVPDYVHLAIVYADSSRRQVRRLANAGAREVVNTAILTQLRFGWPPRAEQSRICRVVEAHDAEVAGRLRVLEKLRLLKHGLLHDLLTGRVRVPLPPEVTP